MNPGFHKRYQQLETRLRRQSIGPRRHPEWVKMSMEMERVFLEAQAEIREFRAPSKVHGIED